jgi:hypothetical protein
MLTEQDALSERLPFNRVTIDKVHLSCAGVYLFWHRKMCIYVGKTDRSLRQRLREHWALCHNDQLRRWIKACGQQLEIQWRCIDDLSSIRAYEQMYIDLCMPLTNKIDAEKKS